MVFCFGRKITEKVPYADIYIAVVSPRDSGVGLFGTSGWSALVVHDDKQEEFYGGESNSNLKKMELVSIVSAIREFVHPCRIIVYHISTKSVENTNKHRRKKSGIKQKGRLWEELQKLRAYHKIKYGSYPKHDSNNYMPYVKKLAYKAYAKEIIRSTSDEVNIYLYADGVKGTGRQRWEGLVAGGGKYKRFSDEDPYTTHNRISLTAAIKTLEILEKPRDVLIFTDSEYLYKCATLWREKWKRNGWCKLGWDEGIPIKNKDLWMKLDELLKIHNNKKWIHETKENIEESMALYESVKNSSLQA